MAYIGVNLPGPFHAGTNVSTKPLTRPYKEAGKESVSLIKEYPGVFLALIALGVLIATGAIIPLAIGLFAAYWIVWRPVVAIQRRRGVDAWTFMDAWRAWWAS